MKKLIYLSMFVLALSQIGCKKEGQAKLSGLYNVSFVFNPTGNPSDIIFKNYQTSEIKTYTGRTEILTINDQVKVGDKYYLEMKGNANGLDNLYAVSVYYKNVKIAGVRALGGAGKSDQFLDLDFTFTESDFK